MEELAGAELNDLEHQTKHNYYGNKFTHYWLKVLENSEAGEHIHENDRPVLEKLVDIAGTYSDDRDKIEVAFTF